MPKIIELKKVRSEEHKEVGQKAALLGEISNLVPVPPSFVLTAKSFQRFIANHRVKLNKILNEPEVGYQEKANQIQSLLRSFHISDEFKSQVSEAYQKLSIDSSNIESAFDLVKPKNLVKVVIRGTLFIRKGAEPLSSYSIKGINKDLMQNIHDSWIELFNYDTIEFMNAEGLDFDDVGISLIISKMILAHKSGVVYSSNPQGDDNRILVEACWGTEDYFLKDDNEPDQHKLDKDDLEIADSIIEEQNYAYIYDKETKENIKKSIPDTERTIKVLKNKELVRIGAMARKLEKHFDAPVEVEFIIDKNKIYLIQILVITDQDEIFEFEQDQISEQQEYQDKRYPGLDAAEEELEKMQKNQVDQTVQSEEQTEEHTDLEAEDELEEFEKELKNLFDKYCTINPELSEILDLLHKDIKDLLEEFSD
ncbi:MAG: Phosphoenolpyruvate synthase [Candidatus Woesearchaeota archaeon]|nr:Phosphoenolpyruvate synthase [Candidatus Woesearchaeota archaeon]